jgi:AbrB family looped-hinge helix DNA binding protein
MFKDNLISLRKLHHMSQEALAEKLGIARQTLSKWETGESVPDIEKCMEIAKIFDVTLDDLTGESCSQFGMKLPPKGKHLFGMMKVGEKGQIVLPARARRVFNIHPGDHLILLGDENSGLALIKESDLLNLARLAREQSDEIL